jgi:hypothetical protein
VVAQVAAWLASRVSNGKQQQATVVSCCLREEERQKMRGGDYLGHEVMGCAIRLARKETWAA